MLVCILVSNETLRVQKIWWARKSQTASPACPVGSPAAACSCLTKGCQNSGLGHGYRVPSLWAHCRASPHTGVHQTLLRCPAFSHPLSRARLCAAAPPARRPSAPADTCGAGCLSQPPTPAAVALELLVRAPSRPSLQAHCTNANPIVPNPLPAASVITASCRSEWSRRRQPTKTQRNGARQRRCFEPVKPSHEKLNLIML